MTLPVVVLFVCGACLFFLGRFLFARQKSRKATSWPTTQGTILSSSLREVSNIDGDLIYCKPLIRYQYNVKGEVHIGKTVRFGLATVFVGYWARTIAQELLVNYRPGSGVYVYFNPANPAESVLEPSEVDFSGAYIAGVIMVVSIGIGWLARIYRLI